MATSYLLKMRDIYGRETITFCDHDPFSDACTLKHNSTGDLCCNICGKSSLTHNVRPLPEPRDDNPYNMYQSASRWDRPEAEPPKAQPRGCVVMASDPYGNDPEELDWDALIALADKFTLPIDAKIGAGTFTKGVKLGTFLRSVRNHERYAHEPEGSHE